MIALKLLIVCTIGFIVGAAVGVLPWWIAGMVGGVVAAIVVIHSEYPEHMR